MLHALLFILVHFLGLQLACAQRLTTSPGPYVSCGLTARPCTNINGGNGCCSVGNCCGNGCCSLYSSCVNEGTSEAACCPLGDPTRCGTYDPDQDNRSGDSDGSSGRCVGIDACPTDPERGLGWTCVLGQKCGLRYNECYPCIPGFNAGDPGSTRYTSLRPGPSGSSSSHPEFESESNGSSSPSLTSEKRPSGPTDEAVTTTSSTSSDGADETGEPDRGGFSMDSRSAILRRIGLVFFVMVVLVL